MNKSLSFPVIFLILNQLINYSVEGLKNCDPNEECILTSKCPAMVKLLQSNNRESINTVRNAICQYQGRRALVCCPTLSSVKATTETPFLIQTPESLLPTRCGKPATDDRIIGGSPAPIGAYPWVAALGYSERGASRIRFLCSGSLINSRYVLTAAHCVDEAALRFKNLAVINLGDWDLSSDIDCETKSNGGQKCAPAHMTAGVESITIHPNYDKRAVSSDDIALIRLNSSIDFDTVEADVLPVCLAEPAFLRTSMENEMENIAAGWGLTENGTESDILLRVKVPFADEALCKKRYSTRFLDGQLCIGGKGGSDTCSGDSGGPLVIPGQFGPPFYQIGIVSYGTFPCGLNKIPGVYTSVSDYRDWIIENLKP